MPKRKTILRLLIGDPTEFDFTLLLNRLVFVFAIGLVFGIGAFRSI